MVAWITATLEMTPVECAAENSAVAIHWNRQLAGLGKISGKPATPTTNY